MNKPCSSCGGARDRPGQRYCSGCHAAYMRRWNAARVLELLKLRKIVAERAAP